MQPLKFDISLTVLDHLGRNLYRSFGTVLGEAISNAWDAEAENIKITYKPENHYMCIIDDGFGMSREDLQNKFLKIGYSKRDVYGFSSPNKKRPHIGRKGIGKLALLSCAERVTILSKTKEGGWAGVIIDNSEIDKEIKRGSGTAHYELKEPDLKLYKEICTNEKGTILCFEELKEERTHTEEFLRKIIALYFRFSLVDPEFKIFFNENEVTIKELSDLANKTQFVWTINSYKNDPFLEMLTTSQEKNNIDTTKNMYGFISSVKRPSDRNIFGVKERIGVDLFVNGRVREVDILKHFPSSQVPEEYLYGQIHINSLDDEGEVDRFTSSRENVQADDPIYKEYLKEIKSLVSKIMNQWDDLRDKHNDDGDPENTTRETTKIKKAKSLYREVAKDYIEGSSEESSDREFIGDLTDDAAFNSNSYIQCFISENLLRKHIEESSLTPTTCNNKDPKGNTCTDRYNPSTGNTSLCEFCKGERGKQSLQKQKTDANTSIKIRTAEDNILMYLDYIDLAKIINNKILKEEDKPYKPLRNSVMHTSRLTDEAKTKLTSVFDNVVSTVRKLMTK